MVSFFFSRVKNKLRFVLLQLTFLAFDSFISVFRRRSVGVIGVAGSVRLPFAPLFCVDFPFLCQRAAAVDPPRVHKRERHDVALVLCVSSGCKVVGTAPVHESAVVD